MGVAVDAAKREGILRQSHGEAVGKVLKSANLYHYTFNNPVNFIDPWGLDAHHIIPQALWKNLNLTPEVEAVFKNAVVEAGEHYYTATHREYSALVRTLWENFFLDAKPEKITKCAAEEFLMHVKSQPEAKRLLARILAEGGAGIVPKWLKRGGKIGARVGSVAGWILLIGDAVLGSPANAY